MIKGLSGPIKLDTDVFSVWLCLNYRVSSRENFPTFGLFIFEGIPWILSNWTEFFNSLENNLTEVSFAEFWEVLMILVNANNISLGDEVLNRSR